MQIFIRSRPALASNDISGVRTAPSRIFSLVTGMTNSRFANTISNSLSNIKAHYDLSNGMFSAFLSKDMTYSCAIFKDLDGDLNRLEEIGEVNGALGLIKFGKGQKQKNISNGDHGDKAGETTDGKAEIDELEEAQLAKLRYVTSAHSVSTSLTCQAYHQAGRHQARTPSARDRIRLGQLRYRGECPIFRLAVHNCPIITLTSYRLFG